MKKNKEARGRKVLQWLMAPLVPLVIVAGYFWPYLGFIAIGFMLLMFILVWFRGRFYCGWICPMGAFHERILARVSLKKPMLPLFRKTWFKWLVLTLMLGLLTARLIMSGGDPEVIAAIFVMMWTISTGFAVALGLVWKPRSWCSFCPMGTVQGLLAPRVRRIHVAAACRQCGLCRKVCPLEIYPGAYREEGVVSDPTCLRCLNCVAVCPQGALSLRPEENRRPEGESCSAPACGAGDSASAPACGSGEKGKR
jgi:polyferredoxin